MTLDGRVLRGFFEHERLKPANVRTSQGNVQNLVQLKKSYECRVKNLINTLLTKIKYLSDKEILISVNDKI